LELRLERITLRLGNYILEKAGPIRSTSRLGYEPDEMPVTDAMLSAGREAFVRWFRQPQLEGLLVGLPEEQDLDSLAQSIFASMMSARPEV
jgi:hypothetical protein